jgi:type I restriction enzyme S subunit
MVVLSDIIRSLESGSRPKGGAKNIKEGIPSIGGEHLVYGGSFDFSQIRYIPKTFYNQMLKGKVEKYDILIVKDGATTGKTSFVDESFEFQEAAINEHIFIMRSFDEIHPKFLFFYMISPIGQFYIKKNFQGSAQGGINSNFIKNIYIPVPPVNEQKRIVSKLEELFTKLDAGIEYLKKTKTLLKQYRQSILKYAFEGKLTEKWREKNSNEISQTSVIFEKLESQKLINKRKEFPRLDLKTLNGIPEGWMWIRIQDIADYIQYGTSERANADSNGIPVIRMGNIQSGKIIFENLKYYPKSWKGLDGFLLSEGDVLFNRTNSAELVGKAAVYESIYPKSAFASYLIRIKILRNLYNPKLLSFFINSIFGKQYIKSVVSQQVGQANVNGTKLAAMPIPFLSIHEQNIIVEEIETKFSILEHTENIIQKNLSYCERLRQSIFKDTFEGKLVVQDPNDEPASVLLEKIKQKKSNTEKKSNLKRTKNKSDSRQMRLI